jgi:hypothetical protein
MAAHVVDALAAEATPRPPGRRPRWALAARLVGAHGPALLAAGLAMVVAAGGWHGTDTAAQVYRAAAVANHGLQLWDWGWYGGNFPLAYSVLFPPLAAGLGLAATGVAAAAAATAGFDRLLSGWWGRRTWGSWYFAVATALAVAIGQLPYLAGEAVGMWAVVALRRRRYPAAAVLALACGLLSGVDGVFLAVAVGGWVLSRRQVDRRGVWMAAVAAVPVAAGAALEVVFPGTGPFPYPAGGLVWVLAACALTAAPDVRQAPAVRAGAAAYAAMAVVAFLAPTPMGGNANRLAQVVGVPLLLSFAGGEARRRRATPRAAARVVVVAALAAWAWAPGLDLLSPAAGGPATTAAFYRPLLRHLAGVAPLPVKVEVPPTRQHWESVYVAERFPLARGWERQLDIADNPLFYRPGALSPSSYRAWLLREGVSYVALPAAPLDYAARAEGIMLRRGQVPGLVPVWASGQWQLWRVAASPGLATGPGAVVALPPGAVTLSVWRPGTVVVRFRANRYWTVTAGAACVARSPGGWLAVTASRPGRVTVRPALTGPRRRCPAASAGASSRPAGSAGPRRAAPPAPGAR